MRADRRTRLPVAAALTALTALASTLLSPQPAAAEPTSHEARQRAEQAFILGRLADLDPILGAGTTPADQEPLYVRDGIWRPARDLPPLPPDDGTISSRRIRWIVYEYRAGTAALASYPRAAAGEVDPFPRITALVLDRAYRETKGAEGLPEAGPLAHDDDPVLVWLKTAYAAPVFAGTPRTDLSPEELAAERDTTAAIARAADRNRTIAIVSVGGLAAAAILAGLLLRRRRKASRPPADS